MHYIFIVNSRAHKKVLADFNKALSIVPKSIAESIEVAYTEHAGHAEELAIDYSDKYGTDAIIFACGGDGSVHEIANGLAFRNTPMAVFPLGTGNDFARTVLPKEFYRDPFLFFKNLSSYEIRPIDLLRIDSYDAMGNHLPIWSKYSLNVASMGLDTLVQAKAKAMVAAHPKSLFYRKNAYSIAAVSCLLNGWNYRMDFSIELANKETITKKNVAYSLTSICNAKYYGNGFCPAPDAVIDDGILNVCVVSSMSRMKAFGLLSKYKQGKHIGQPGITMYQAKSGVFSSLDSNFQLQGNYDGEDFYGHQVRFEVIPQAIQYAFFNAPHN
ncbi:MAG TPA: diacylglycerol kinase family protein [Bacillota bacterium]|nr:diacylglycerol kinase family protein [Bacillota bacterium]HPE38791.1 diacylglycerol kinase family protein [Bacillota bacterium]